jgi:fucose permease
MGSVVILSLGGTSTGSAVETVQGPYLGLAALLCLIAIIFSRFKLPKVSAEPGVIDPNASTGSLWRKRPKAAVWKRLFAPN